jgi:rifampin ADP-ribosylating transferase
MLITIRLPVQAISYFSRILLLVDFQIELKELNHIFKQRRAIFLLESIYMQFDPENHVNKLCAEGMHLEAEGQPEKASKLFRQAWNDAENDLEKFTAAHYIARHQKSISDKLHWDKTALNLALKIPDENIKMAYPSLYLNIGKCHEELNDFVKAHENYGTGVYNLFIQ